MAAFIVNAFKSTVFSFSFLRLKHSDARIGDKLWRKPKISKHWNNESVRQNAIERREKLIYETPTDESEFFSRSPNDEGLEFDNCDPEYAEHLLEKYIKRADKFDRLKELKTTERRYFRKPPETNLLTWAMKEKIRYLHHTDPDTWTIEELAKGFPISEAGINKLLKSKFVLKSPEKIQRHDREVAERWKKAGLSGGPIAVKMMEENSRDLQLVEASESQSDPKPRKIGFFTSILAKTNPEMMKREDENHEHPIGFRKNDVPRFGEQQMTAEDFMRESGLETNNSTKEQKKVQVKKKCLSEENSTGFVKITKYKEPRRSLLEDGRFASNVKGQFTQVGDTIYDENGKFLYRIAGFKVNTE